MLCNFQFACVFQTKSLQTKDYPLSWPIPHHNLWPSVKEFPIQPHRISRMHRLQCQVQRGIPCISCRIVWNDLSTHRSLCRLLITSTVLWSHLTDAAGVPLASHTRLTVLPYSPRVSGRRFDENIGASAKKQTTYCYMFNCNSVDFRFCCSRILWKMSSS